MIEKFFELKILLWFMSKTVLPVFSSKSFIVSGLTFRSLIYFEILCVCVVLGSKFHFFTCSCLVYPAPRVEETINENKNKNKQMGPN